MKVFKLGTRSYPYSYTRCLLSSVDTNGFDLPLIVFVLIMTVLLETLTLPVYPLIFSDHLKMHRSEQMHKGEKA